MIELLATLVGSPVSLEELKFKPGRRRTLRATGSRRTAIVKLFESERTPFVAARIAALAAGPPEPIVPEVLHVDRARRMLVLSEVPGNPLREFVVAGDLVACARVGKAIADWHRAWCGRSPDGLGPRTADDERTTLLARAEQAPPPLASVVRSLLPSLLGAWSCTTVVHRDLYEEQIVLGDRVGLIDLDDAALGPPELDVGNLLAHLELLELRSGGSYDAAVEALLGGYDASSLDERLLDRCRRLSLLRLACIHEEAALVERAQTESDDGFSGDPVAALAVGREEQAS